MIKVELKYELERCSKALREYGKESGKDENEVLAKHGSKLAWNISRGLKKLAPGKGSIRAERLAALKGGGGVFVRPVVQQEIAAKYNATYSLGLDRTLLAQRGGKKGKGKVASYSPQILKDGRLLNLQALMVERELALRESARGFSGYAAPRPPRSYAAEAAFDSDRLDDIESRYGFLLSTFGIKLQAEHKFVELKWLGAQGDGYQDALRGLRKGKQEAVLIEAVRETTRDVMEYVQRKNKERAERHGL